MTTPRGDNRVLEDTLVEEDIHPVYVSEGATDTGRVRTANQDAFAQLGARGIWAIADGMGGYRDGDVASRMVCEGLQSLEGAPTLDRVIFKRYTNPETMVQDLRAGEIDFAESIPVELFRSLEGQEGIQTNVGGSFSFSQMSFNQCFTQKACEDSTGHPALRDVEVRQAIEMAIDKENLVERVLGGYGTPGTTIVVPTAKFWHWAPPEDEALPDGDIEAANAKLDAAGYGQLVCKMPHKNRDGTPLRSPPRPLLARDRVLYVGEPLAVVIAETAAAAKDGAELIEVDTGLLLWTERWEEEEFARKTEALDRIRLTMAKGVKKRLEQ